MKFYSHNTVADTIRRLMIERGITESELARRTNLPQTTINRILLGLTQDPRMNTITPIAKEFGLTIDQVLGKQPILVQDQKAYPENFLCRSIIPIPIIQWNQIMTWVEDRRFPMGADYILSEKIIAEEAFALNSTNGLASIAHPHSILLVDPHYDYKDGSLVIVSLNNNKPAVRKLLIDGACTYLKPVSPEIPIETLTEGHKIIGTIIEVRMPFE